MAYILSLFPGYMYRKINGVLLCLDRRLYSILRYPKYKKWGCIYLPFHFPTLKSTHFDYAYSDEELGKFF